MHFILKYLNLQYNQCFYFGSEIETWRKCLFFTPPGWPISSCPIAIYQMIRRFPRWEEIFPFIYWVYEWTPVYLWALHLSCWPACSCSGFAVLVSAGLYRLNLHCFNIWVAESHHSYHIFPQIIFDCLAFRLYSRFSLYSHRNNSMFLGGTYEVYKLSIWEGYSVFKIDVFACWFKHYSRRGSCAYIGKPEAVQRANGKMWANHSVLSLSLPLAIEVWVSGVCSSRHTEYNWVWVCTPIILAFGMRKEDYQEFKVILAIYWVSSWATEWDPPLSWIKTLCTYKVVCVYSQFALTPMPFSPDGCKLHTLFCSSPSWNTYWEAFHTSTNISALSPLTASWHFTIWYS